MIKVKKVEFGQFGVELLLPNVDLRAMSLLREQCVENKCSGHDGTEICSKIISIEKDFSVKELVPEQASVFVVCACYGNSVIYCEDVYDEKTDSSYRLYRSTSSKNEYVATGTASNSFHDDLFVVEERDYCSNSKKVTTLDMDLNVIKSCVMGYRDANEYEDAELDIMGAYNNYTGEITYRYSELIIGHINSIEEAKRYNANNCYTFITTCYDKIAKKHYLIRFNRSCNIDWKAEISDRVLYYNVKSLNDNCYVLDCSKRGHKYWLKKYGNNGELLDVYEFKAYRAMLYTFNNKIVIMCTDIFSLNCEQLNALKKGELLVWPTSLLVIDEWD